MESQVTTPAQSSGRLLSLDALRGFDMFWIVGMDEVFEALSVVTGTHFAKSLDHAAWVGLHFYDFIFPLFVFIIGVSQVFSLRKSVEQDGRMGATMKVLRRGLILFFLGFLYYGGVSKLRWLGVLQRLAICSMGAGLCIIWLKTKGRVAVCASILVGYWALLTFVPVPGVGAGNYKEGMNLTNYLDKMYLPGFRWDGDHDPEGMLSTLPAIAQCLLGVFAGTLLMRKDLDGKKKVSLLVMGGVALIALGFLWGMQFPIIKKLWTSTFVLVTSGVGAILLALFYNIIDVKGYNRWCTPFVWIGMNAITIYFVHSFFNFAKLGNGFFGGELGEWLDRLVVPGFSHLLVTLAVLTFVVLFVRFLYQRKIFIRV